MRKKAELSRALFLNRLEEGLPPGFDRLYFGAEFCPWALPGKGECLAALTAAHQAGWAFSLSLPVLAEPLLPVVRELVAELAPRFAPEDEVVVSDLGALRLLRETGAELPVVLGRALSGQKRGAQILDLPLSAEQLNYFRQGSWYSAEAVRLLGELGLARVELDNLLQGMAPLPRPLCGSLHHPFVMVTSSRNCPFRPPAGAGCDAACGEAFSLVNPQSRLPLLQGGNTQFLRQEELPDDLAALGIDRLVLHPRLPR